MERRELIGGLLASVLASGRARADVRCNGPDYNGFLNCEAGIPSFAFSSARQSQSQWCWAACIEMVANHYGHNLSQTTIVQSVFGRLVNLPAMSWNIVQAFNRSWIDDNGLPMSTSCDVLWDATMGIALPNAAQLSTQYLSQNRPLIIGALGHAMVLTSVGFTRSAMNPSIGRANYGIVRDPWPGNAPRRQLSLQEFNSVQLMIAPSIV
jgi:hypothetical protein